MSCRKLFKCAFSTPRDLPTKHMVLHSFEKNQTNMFFCPFFPKYALPGVVNIELCTENLSCGSLCYPHFGQISEWNEISTILAQSDGGISSKRGAKLCVCSSRSSSSTTHTRSSHQTPDAADLFIEFSKNALNSRQWFHVYNKKYTTIDATLS